MVDGTEQRERKPAALEAGYFRVDETGFGTQAAMAEGFAAHLRFRAAQGADEGTWAALFETDELLVMAGVLGYDPAPLRAALLDDFEAAPLRKLVQGVLLLASVLDRWYRRLHAIDAAGAQAVADVIASLIDTQLAADMQWLGQHFAPQGWSGELKGYAYGSLDPAWLQPGRGARPAAGRPQRDVLRSAVFALLDAIARTQDAAAAHLPASRSSQRHEPAAGLLAAFMDLFQRVQGHINGFTARHTGFYYHDVLGMRPRRAQPDCVHLVCERVPGASAEVVLPRGTAFAAGKDANQQPIEFLTDSELVVSDVKVAALRSLRLERATLVLGQGQRFESVQRIVADSPGTAAGGAQFWPLFGGAGGQGTASAHDAQLGLAVASPVLRLKEGQREIRVTLGLRDTGGPQGLWASMAGGDDLVQWQFVRALPELFRISLTTEDGWWDPPDCFVARCSAAEGEPHLDGLEVTIRLRPEAPAVTGLKPQVHGDGWDTQLPVMRILVRQDAAMCAYSLLDKAVLEQARVQVRVRGARDLALGNQLGRLDPSTPFMPFGPMPEPGSYLVFGSAEAAGKPLRRMRLNLQWGGLPQGMGGFAEHYAGYDTSFSDLGFKAKVSVLQEGMWRVAPGEPDGRPIFRLGPGGRLTSSSSIPVDQDILQAYFKAGVPSGEPFVYGVGSRNGFFRWELREPAAGFGHAEYARVLTRVVSANARRKKNPLPMPNPPYTPVVERATLDYEAEATIRLGGPGAAAASGEIFHLHPFGLERIHPAAPGPRGVLPVWLQDGNLYIGLSGQDVQGQLSLLFELRGESAQPLLHRKARVSWAFLSGNTWSELAGARVLSDTTSGFLTSGIVTLDLPAGLDSGSSVMPAGLCWLRVSADADYESFAGLYSVRAQAVCAWRSPSSTLPKAYEALPPGSIGAPMESVPGLAKVVQVGPSFGMRPTESLEQLQIRTGERLRHKNRAQLPWDFERLVLERFPSVLKVRCFSNLAVPDAGSDPGSVLVVVVPAPSGQELAKNVPGPRLSAVELERIEQYLVSQASPFARITVRNATYERIQVRCSIAWKPGSNAGHCERQLSQALFDYLSPWNDNGHRARFEWSLRREDVEAFIRGFDAVEFVCGVSLLHVAESDGGLHSLDDTARPGGAAQWDATAAQRSAGRAGARWPWSIAVPMRRHLIETLERAAPTGPVPTGVGRLAIGNTFIVGAQA